MILYCSQYSCAMMAMSFHSVPWTLTFLLSTSLSTAGDPFTPSFLTSDNWNFLASGDQIPQFFINETVVLQLNDSLWDDFAFVYPPSDDIVNSELWLTDSTFQNQYNISAQPINYTDSFDWPVPDFIEIEDGAQWQFVLFPQTETSDESFNPNGTLASPSFAILDGSASASSTAAATTAAPTSSAASTSDSSVKSSSSAAASSTFTPFDSGTTFVQYSSGGLGSGAKAAISVGSIAGAASVFGLGFLLSRKRRLSRAKNAIKRGRRYTRSMCSAPHTCRREGHTPLRTDFTPTYKGPSELANGNNH